MQDGVMNMNLKFKEPKERFSLILTVSAIIIGIIMITTVIVGVVVFFLIYQGSIRVETEMSASTLFGIYFLLSIITGTLLSFFLIRVPLKPVNKILNAMNRLASGDYSVRLRFKGPVAKQPTILGLTESFNTMAEELGQIEMLRSDFINNFSHEFKTPIVSIAGFAKLLRRGNLPEEARNEYLAIIEEESMRLSQLATNVLNLTKVENQVILTDADNFNLSEQIRNCFLMLETKWGKKNIDPLLPEDEFTIYGNEEMLKQVWINLLDNAIKFSEQNKPVEVTIRQNEDKTEVSVSNYGESIPKKSIDRIFNKFYQADQSHATEGNGVGLAVVKKIVELHAGEIRVDHVDGKVVFTIILPTDGV